MEILRQSLFKRKEKEDDRAGPELLRVGVYGLDSTAESDDCFELRGEDEQGRVHFTYRDPRKLMVLQEYDITVSELVAQYEIENETTPRAEAIA